VSALREAGAHVHTLERFHGKVYLNEKEVIVCSFNLVGASQSSVEFGVHFTDSRLARLCHKELQSYCPDLGKGVLGRLLARVFSKEQPATEAKRGFCIACGKDKSYHTGFPLCNRCYHASDKGNDVAAFSQRVCHACGKPSAVTRRSPLCKACS